MSQLQASIQFLVDYHGSDTGTLEDLDPLRREDFLTRASTALYTTKLGEFVMLMQSADFRPKLSYEGATKLPSYLEVNQKIVEAIKAYNNGNFPLGFNFEALEEKNGALPDYDCIQWVWINGEWVKRYNYDLVVSRGNLETEGNLEAKYRITLSHST